MSLLGFPPAQGRFYGDATTLAAAALFLLSVSVVACLLPAERAVRVDPVVDLRYE